MRGLCKGADKAPANILWHWHPAVIRYAAAAASAAVITAAAAAAADWAGID
jgi:hypothetical protein